MVTTTHQTMGINKTAAYTICFNEIKKIDQWLQYTQEFDYRVVLDTGSTDGTYEALKKVPGIILEQKRMEPFLFHEHRNYNLGMIPDDVEWCISPDMDEYFSINVLEEMEKTIRLFPTVTNIACDRLDIYSKIVRVGPPDHIPTNKIHRKGLYTWKSPIYEHLWFKESEYLKEVEIYNKDIYLIHDQDINKPRSTLYPSMMKDQYNRDETDTWNSWYLLNHYYRERDILNYIKVACSFIYNHIQFDEKYREVWNDLLQIYKHENSINNDIRDKIKQSLKIE